VQESEIPLTPERVPELILQGLLDTITHYNPKRLVRLIEQEAPRFRELFDWTPEREMGMWMHVGIYMDQLLAAQLHRTQAKVSSQSPPAPKPPTAHLTLWEGFLQQLEQDMGVRFPPAAAHELARLSAETTNRSISS
jgi:hypothetical protein